MIKINYNRDLFINKKTESTERILCIPFENKELFIEDEFENNRFSEVINCGNEYLQFTQIKDCDFIFLPFKFKERNQIVDNEINKAKILNKKIITIFNDDQNLNIPISEDEGYIFKTSFNKSSKKKNEFAFPAFCGDFFTTHNGYFNNNINSVSFCGAITHQYRAKILNQVNKIKNFEKNFLIRQNFFATELPRMIARNEYIENIKSSTFNICTRGAGNFSYRFYETFMMGRIPIFINTDCVLPFENLINYNDSLILIEENQITDIEQIINNWLSGKSTDDIIDIQKNNRKIWIEYFSPLGWIKNFTKELK